jgi:hypothetical protein
MSSSSWQLPSSEDFTVRSSSNAGWGVFALRNLQSGTHLLTTSPILSPTSYVILRAYRREVCAWCFAYDRGRDWKTRPSNTALAFCKEDCRDEWLDFYGNGALAAHQALETAVQRTLKDRNDAKMTETETFHSADVARQKWEQAARVSDELRLARGAPKLSKPQRQLLRQHSEVKSIEPDIIAYLLSTGLVPHSATASAALMELAPNHNVYESASLEEHIRAFHLLTTILPVEMLSSISASLCEEYVSRASHNAFSIRPTADGDHSGEFLGYGVWPEASFFNHSCDPNVKKVRNGRQWTFTVARDVEEGEELCITYLGGEEKELGVVERRKRVQTEWGFTCGCEKCIRESATNGSDVEAHG